MFRLVSRTVLPLRRAFSVAADELGIVDPNVLGLCSSGRVHEAFKLINSLNSPQSPATYAVLFRACAQLNLLHLGEDLHRCVLLRYPNHPPNIYMDNHLINLYAKCNSLEKAHQLFDKMPERNIVSWTSLISGYAKQGKSIECFSLFANMLTHHRPTEFAYSSVIACCGVEKGKQVHAHALKTRFVANSFVSNALIIMYSNSSELEQAWLIFTDMQFRNIVSWNSMITCLRNQGHWIEAITLFSRLRINSIQFDHTTIIGVVSALCLSSVDEIHNSLRYCFQLHCLTIKTSFDSKIEIATALVKAFSDLGCETSHFYKIFQTTNGVRDIVSWTNMISAFSEREPGKALLIFNRMRAELIPPDCFAFSAVLKACAGLVTERQSSAIHSQMMKYGFESDVTPMNALIHAYARTGSVRSAKRVFDEMNHRDTFSWNSMLKAYALQGRANEAIELFGEMNICPDGATFVALLSACNHAGMVEQGEKIFDRMSSEFGIVPHLDHFACKVDILARSGRIAEADEFISTMPMKPDSVIWKSMLGACRRYGEIGLANRAMEKLKELDPGNSLGYVVMSNMYSSVGVYGLAGKIRNEMNGLGVRKEPGLSWIEVGNEVHEFGSGGERHPEGVEIRGHARRLVRKLKDAGYRAETGICYYDLDEEQREEELLYHSEKLALVFGLMKLVGFEKMMIKINKNIGICVDCHNFMKVSSKVVDKEILIRDSNRFHHFKDGVCSCNDYW
ncbi:pentatricopeptide repeat-containing protein At1g71420 [Impatiens glandulifera]|uniref:pentatricopeptide repeat-containing protein At1g71420 n=1 Tax=Impatiens glandulifera TaxID=253017 RepID=UPI001FB15BE8|nr:pentatricopeptide repeat-containing protein At1g71420 [Impatiens glandulifera]